MKWSRKNKEIKEPTKIGDFKRRVRFALFPAKVENETLWLEKYIKVWEFKKQYRTEEYVVSSGLLEDAFTTTGLINERTVSRTYSFEAWRFHSRELLTTNN